MNHLGARFTVEQDEWLKKHVAEGYSASQLSALFYEEFKVDRSRNSIIGRAHRLGLQIGSRVAVGRNEKSSANVHRPATPKRPPPAGRITSIARPTAIAPTRPAAVKREPAAAPSNPIGKALFDLKSCDCRWPLGAFHEPATKFCALPIETESKPYCAAHNEMAIDATSRANRFIRGIDRAARAAA